MKMNKLIAVAFGQESVLVVIRMVRLCGILRVAGVLQDCCYMLKCAVNSGSKPMLVEMNRHCSKWISPHRL